MQCSTVSTSITLVRFLYKNGNPIPFVLSSAKQILTKNQQVVPKGYIPIYVGEQADKKRYVVPLSYLSHPVF
ncbi:Auxin-responsive protein SAUR21 [Bienertia sinuspersici]